MIDRLYVLRHGQSTANAAGVYAGQRADIQLTEHGRDQARTAGKLLARDGITKIIASDYDRAKNTAIIAAGVIGYPVNRITYDIRLREVCVGKLAGQPDHGFPEYLNYVKSGVDTEAESYDQVAQRVRPLLRELATEDGIILLVAHAGVVRVLRTLTTGIPLEEIGKLDVPNAHPIELPINLLEEL